MRSFQTGSWLISASPPGAMRKPLKPFEQSNRFDRCRLALKFALMLKHHPHLRWMSVPTFVLFHNPVLLFLGLGKTRGVSVWFGSIGTSPRSTVLMPYRLTQLSGGPKPDPINPRRKHLCNSCRWQTSSNLQGKCLWSELRKNVVKILTKAFRVILATARTRSAARRMSATGVSRKTASQIFLATLYEWQCNLGNNHRGAQVFGRTQPRPV